MAKHMIHGPCGNANLRSLCMVSGKCKKKYPRPFQSETSIGEYGYLIYRRRCTGDTVTKNETILDNRSIVPHNVNLVVKHDCHCNVEKTNKDNCMKYLCKYMHKGTDRSTVVVETFGSGSSATHVQIGSEVDEIKKIWTVGISQRLRHVGAFFGLIFIIMTLK